MDEEVLPMTAQVVITAGAIFLVVVSVLALAAFLADAGDDNEGGSSWHGPL